MTTYCGGYTTTGHGTAACCGQPEWGPGSNIHQCASCMISDLKARSEWRSIETAPKDEQILVWDGCDEMFVGRWSSGSQWISSSCVDGWTSMTPTHWMPLPDPPK